MSSPCIVTEPITTSTKRYTSADQLLARISSFVSLSSDTEFGHYREPQWAFLLGGEDVSAHVVEVVYANATAQGERGGAVFQGCVLSIQLNDSAGESTTVGLGMVLVDPAHRRKGIARRLIQSAMIAQARTKYVLAVCSEAGYPLYRSLGFQDAGMVYAMSCSVGDLRRYARALATNNKHGIRTADGNGVRGARDIIYRLDQNATGYDRRGRLNLLLDAEYASGASSRSVFGYYNGTDDASNIPGGCPPCAFAISRRDCKEGGIIIGPMVGPAISAVPLLCHISQHCPEDDDNRILSILISNHKEDVVDRLLQVEGFSIAWTGPAMTTDGQGIYKDENSYLALMHPTLG